MPRPAAIEEGPEEGPKGGGEMGEGRLRYEITTKA
jgi:hypothetical protein